jgi:hypothetical protein
MHAYCVNLEKRKDRRRDVRAEFDREGLAVEFFRATDGRVGTPSGIYVTPSEYGCSMSHTRIWKDIVEKGHALALIMEDDVRLIPNFKTKLQQILEEAKSIPWDIIHLGPLIPIFKQNVSESLYEGQPLGTHAYLIRLECARKIYPFDPSLMKVSVDFQLNRFPIKILCTYETLAKQVSMEDAPLVGLMKSAFEGDIGLDRTYDLNYFIRYAFQKFGIIIALLVSFVILILIRN